MTPAKKAAPAKSLKDLLSDNKDEEVPVDAPAEDAPEDTEVTHSVDAEDNPRVATNEMPDTTAGKTQAFRDELGNVSTVPTWQEVPDHNLGKVHPDVLPQPQPVHQSQTSRTVYVTEYAQPAELDDKGLVGPEVDPDNPQEEEYVSEYAGENENDDKNLKRNER